MGGVKHSSSCVQLKVERSCIFRFRFVGMTFCRYGGTPFSIKGRPGHLCIKDTCCDLNCFIYS